MSIPVDSQLVRRNDADFILVDDNDLGGSLRVVPDVPTRDAIPSAMLKVGMLVYTQTPPAYWQLTIVSPPTYIPFNPGGGTGLPPFSGTNGAVVTEEGNPTPFAVFRQLTQDDILPAFTPVLATGPSTPVEVGATIANPQFTATYNYPPTSATLTDSTDTQVIASPFTSFGYGPPGLFPARMYTKATINGTETWTLAASSGGPTKFSSRTVTWQARRFYGAAAVPGLYNEAFIESLSTSQLAPGFAGVYVFVTPGPSQKLYLSWPTAFGNPSSIKDQNGFVFPMTKVATAVPVTNTFAILIPGGYDIWESDNFITAQFTLTVT